MLVPMKKAFVGCAVLFGILMVISVIVSAVMGVRSGGGSSGSDAADGVSVSDSVAGKSDPVPKVDPAEIKAKRDAVVGQTFSTLTIGEAQFEDATVEEITDERIKIKHSSGVATLAWNEVPEEVQEKWGYDPAAFAEVVAARKEFEEEQAKKFERQKKEMAKAEAKKTSNHVGAYVYMQQFVERKLKSPKTADFPGPASKYCRPLGDYRYRVDAYVDSQNSFGALIRTKFSGIIKENVGEDTWTIESLNFYE